MANQIKTGSIKGRKLGSSVLIVEYIVEDGGEFVDSVYIKTTRDEEKDLSTDATDVANNHFSVNY